MAELTERLYHQDPWLTSFRARVIGHGSWKERPTLLLDRTAFYPESGGQGADRGRLQGLAVVDVQQEGLVVHHLVEPGDVPLPPIGEEIEGELDLPRRRLHMAEHTAQHMLSSALLAVARANTVSTRLGEHACTIDLDRPSLSPEELEEAQARVHAAIDADLPVRAFFPGADELSQLCLRKPSRVEENIRVVAIGDFDLVPCGGTHCTRTGQIGLVQIVSADPYKGMTRVTFVAGARARSLLQQSLGTLQRIARELTCGLEAVPQTIEKLTRELARSRSALHACRDRLAGEVAAKLLADCPGALVVGCFEGMGPEFLRAVGQHITAAPGRVALLADRDAEGTAVFAARGPASSFECGAFLRFAAREGQGRGNGRPEHAEGRLPGRIDWPALVARFNPP